MLPWLGVSRLGGFQGSLSFNSVPVHILDFIELSNVALTYRHYDAL